MGTGILARQSSSSTSVETSDSDAAAAKAPTSPVDGLTGGLTDILKRQSEEEEEEEEEELLAFLAAGGVLNKRQPIDVASLTGLSGDSSDKPAGDDTADGLTGGLRKRQLGGLLGDKPATPDADGDDSTQVRS